MFPECKIPNDAARLYTQAVKKTEKLMLPLLTCMKRVGQAQLLKKMISTELQFKSRLDANLLFQAVNTLDMNIMIDLKEDLRDPSKEGMVKEENPLLGGLSQLLETSGNYDVFSKIFITSVPLEGLPVLLMLFVVSYIGKMEYDPDFGSLVRVKGAPLDGYPLVSGMATLLKQFHPSYGTSCIGYLGQFIRSTVHGVLGEREGKEGLGGDVRGKEGGRGGLPREVSTCMVFSQQLASTMGVDAGALSRHVPDFLINCVN